MNMKTSAQVTRRDFIFSAAMGAAGLACGLNATAATGKRIPVGVQLYSVREQCKQDLPGTLKAISKIGYKGVEFAGYYERSATELKKMLDDNGLIACGTHTPLETVQPANLDKTIEFNRTLGNKYLIVPWMEGKTKQEWLDKAKLFNDIEPRARKAGMFVGYHAHQHDFHKLEGIPAWDLFFGNTKKSVVMQLDTSNCIEGGADPLEVLKRYPGRARTIHLKSNGAGPEGVIGEDKIDWKGVFEFCEGKGKTEWYIVEHESSKDPVDAVKRSFEALRKMGKV